MKFCPTCGKPVHLANKVGESVINDENTTIEYSYSCEGGQHKWIEVVDPYGGPGIIREVR